jgi:hypothetical protein
VLINKKLERGQGLLEEARIADSRVGFVLKRLMASLLS